MITDTKLARAIEQARQFIIFAEIAQARLRQEKYPGDLARITGCKETGAVRRKSMDLTRVLAELRSSKQE